MYKILVGKPERMRTFGIPKLRRENNIRMDLRETEWEGVNWMNIA
jgi:hypothetical protein